MSELNKFANLKKIKNEVDLLLNNLKLKLNKLKEIYIDFIDNNKSNVFIFGLDSFYFQNKLLDDEYNNIINFYKRILNRMYCEYYKLFKLVTNYVKENVSDNKIIDLVNQNVNNIVVYKDLEPNKEYDFKQFEIVNNELLSIISLLHNKLSEKEKTLIEHQEKQNIGLNINNFVSSYNYDVAMFKNQINLFENYLSFFYKLHFKYLQRFITKVQVFFTQINHDIVFDNGLIETPNSTNDNDDNAFEFDDDSDVDGDLTGEIINTLQRSISKCNISKKKNNTSKGDNSNESVSTVKKNRRKTMDKNVKININEVLPDMEMEEYIEKINKKKHYNSCSSDEEDGIDVYSNDDDDDILSIGGKNTIEKEEVEEDKEEVEEDKEEVEEDKEEVEEDKEEVEEDKEEVEEHKEEVEEHKEAVEEEKIITKVKKEDDNNSEYSIITAGSGFISDNAENNSQTSKTNLTKSQKKRLRKKLNKLNEITGKN
jgi:hypothetical protein